MANDYIDDTPSVPTGRRCVVCDKTLSLYNDSDQCFHHSEVTPGERESIEYVPEDIVSQVGPSTDNTTQQKEIVNEQSVITLVCETLRVHWEDIISATRKAEIVQARQVIMYLLYRDTKLSYPAIGQLLGGRDHSTVMHGANNIATLNMVDDVMHTLIKNLRSKY